MRKAHYFQPLKGSNPNSHPVNSWTVKSFALNCILSNAPQLVFFNGLPTKWMRRAHGSRAPSTSWHFQAVHSVLKPHTSILRKFFRRAHFIILTSFFVVETSTAFLSRTHQYWENPWAEHILPFIIFDSGDMNKLIGVINTLSCSI